MKKKYAVLIVMLIAAMLLLASCSTGNRQVGWDSIQTFDKYTIVIGEQVLTGTVESWRDFEDSDVIQITSTNGITYLTHYRNVLLEKTK